MARRFASVLRAAVLLMSVFAAGVASACGGGGGTREVGVVLQEWSVAPAKEEVRSGSVVFVVENRGARLHELVVVKSDFPPDALDVVDGKADEAKLNIAGRAGPLTAGTTRRFELSLSAGKYVLICNVVERPAGGAAESHYEKGMYASFFVPK